MDLTGIAHGSSLPKRQERYQVERQQVLSTRSACRWVVRRMKPAIRHYGTPLSMGQIRRAVPDRVALEVRTSLFE